MLSNDRKENTSMNIKRNRLIKTACYLFMMLFTTQISGQDFSKNDLLKDLVYLEEVIDEAHPINLNSAFKNKLGTVIDSISNQAKEQYTILEYYTVLRIALAKVACYHTHILPNYVRIIDLEQAHFPYKLWTNGSQLYALAKSAEDEDLPILNFPEEILTINGEDVKDFLPNLLVFLASDGDQGGYARSYFNDYSTLMTRQYFERDSLFDITGVDSKVQAKALTKIDGHGFERRSMVLDSTLLFTSESIKLYGVNGLPQTLYLLVEDFEYSNGKKKHKELFAEIWKRQTEHLIIDIRNNGGGKTKNGIDLLSYFTKEDFTTSDIVFTGRKGKYLPPSLSRLGVFFWEAVNIAKRTPYEGLGRKYVSKKSRQAKQYEKQVYLLLNSRTGSTSTLFAAYMKYKTNALLIGEETGGGETGDNAGSYSKIKLPVSQIKIRIPLVRINSDIGIPDNHHGIHPDVLVEYGAQEVLLEKDLELQEVYKLIKTKEGKY